MRKIPLTFSLYENMYNTEYPCEQYYIILFDALPSKTITRKAYSNEILEYFKSVGFIEEGRINTSKRNFDKSREILLIQQEKEIMISTHTNLIKDPDLVTLEILFNIKRGDLSEQLDFGKIKTYQKDPRKSSIQLVKSDMGHLDTEEYDLQIPEINLELNYGAEFVKIHEIIAKRLNTNYDKGIILLHGDPGTGKCVTGKSKIILRDKKTGKVFRKNIEDLI